MLKKQKPLILKSSDFQSVLNMIAFKRFLDENPALFKEEDLIELNHSGNCIVGVVQHIGFLETTLIGPTGLIILHNSKIDKFSITNLTKTVCKEKLFGFHSLFDCKTNL
ncbi:hypothetical protein MKX01_024596, partial [Papaver californicum]